MDSDLWDPPICEDDSSDFGVNLHENWLRSDFYDGYGLFDVMEEDALNEKACAQVRKIMFSTAEAKIKEVEAEIILLQSQVPRADEFWSKKLSTLKEMMNSVDVLIQRLKNEEQKREHDLDFHFLFPEEQQTEHELDSHLQSLEEHSEKLNKMLKDLLDNDSTNIDVQVPPVQSLSPNNEKLETTQSNEQTKLSNSVATACGDKTIQETVGPSCMADETRDDSLNQIEDATKSDFMASCDTQEADVSVQLNIGSSDIHMAPEMEIPDSTTKAEKGASSTNVDKLAVIDQVCTTEQISKDFPLKRKLMTQEDASGMIMINTGKSVDVAGKTTSESVLKENSKGSLILKSKVSDSDITHGEPLEDPASKKGEKARLTEEVKSSGVGEEPHKSNLWVRLQSVILAQQTFSTDSLEMGPKDTKMTNLQRNTCLITPDGHAGGHQSKYNKGTDLNLKKDEGNSCSVDYNLGSDLQSLGKRIYCEASQVTKKHEELKKPRIIAKIHEHDTSISVKEDEVTSNVPSLLPLNYFPSSTMALYSIMSVPQLKAIARDRNLKGYSKLTKSKLIELLKSDV